MKKLLLVLTLVTILTPQVQASQNITPQKAVQCLVGEAGNQGFLGMQAVGEVIRRRRSIKGFYGCKNPVFSQSSPKLREQALKAWEASKTSNITKNATHFENVKAFGMPWWAKKMKKVAKIKDHTFFK